MPAPGFSGRSQRGTRERPQRAAGLGRVNSSRMKRISWRAPADNPFHSVGKGLQPWRPAQDGESAEPDRLSAGFAAPYGMAHGVSYGMSCGVGPTR
jgi:hypothetical protein